MTLTILTTVGLAQLSTLFAAPRHKVETPMMSNFVLITGDPHSLKTPKRKSSLCETIESGGSDSSGGGAGKVVIKQC